MTVSLVTTLTAAMKSQLVGGGLILMISGAVMALLRQTPGKIMALVKHQVQVQVDVLDRDTAFGWLNQWLDAHPYTKKARSVTVSTAYQEDELKVLFAPAPGTHRIKHNGRVFWITRNRTQPGDKGGQISESFTIRSFGRSPSPLRQLMLDAKNLAQKADNTIAIYVSHKDYWTRASTVVARPLTSVMLPEGVAGGVATDIREFMASRGWYAERGIPWRRLLASWPAWYGENVAHCGIGGYSGIQPVRSESRQ